MQVSLFLVRLFTLEDDNVQVLLLSFVFPSSNSYLYYHHIWYFGSHRKIIVEISESDEDI